MEGNAFNRSLERVRRLESGEPRWIKSRLRLDAGPSPKDGHHPEGG